MSADSRRVSSLFGRDAETQPPDLGMDLEEAFQIVGEFGAYQKRAVAVLVLTQVGKRETGGFHCVLRATNPGRVRGGAGRCATWRSAAAAGSLRGER